MKTISSSQTELIEMRCADVGIPRPGPYSSGYFHLRRVVSNVQAFSSPRGKAEQGEVRYQQRRIPVYRLTSERGQDTWTTNKVHVLEPIRAVYAPGYSPGNMTTGGHQ